MKEAKAWMKRHRQLINELDCPKFDMQNPTEADLKECESICQNHWGCHTWRHLRGTRDISEPKPKIKVILV
jgi:hypothetical protein